MIFCVHDWDEKSDDYDRIYGTIRTCHKCGKRQVWEKLPLHLAMMTDIPFGQWRTVSENCIRK